MVGRREGKGGYEREIGSGKIKRRMTVVGGAMERKTEILRES